MVRLYQSQPDTGNPTPALISTVRPPVVVQNPGALVNKHTNLSRKILPLLLTGMVSTAASQVDLSAAVSPIAFSAPQ